MNLKRIFAFVFILTFVFLISCGNSGTGKMSREDSIREIMRDFEDTINKVIKNIEKTGYQH